MDDRFAVEKVIARGRSGVVYRAFDTRLGRPVAIKLIAPELVMDARAVEQFLREAKVLAKIGHPSVAEVFDIGDTPEGPYVVMEWIDGESLAARLRRAGRLPVNDVYALGRQLLGALSAAHGQSVVHGDIKPSNVLLQSPSMDVKLADFGITRDLRQGVPAYATPEKLHGDIGGSRSDIYALGVVLYRSVTGELEGSPDLDKIPSALRPVLARALERDQPQDLGSPGVFARSAGSLFTQELAADDVAGHRASDPDARFSHERVYGRIHCHHVRWKS